jgi:membrane associated rhomboid family serine protease
MGDRDYPKLKQSSLWSDNNALMMLILLNGLAFVILYFIKSVYSLSRIPEDIFLKNVYSWFTVPSDWQKFLYRPWTLLTAPFVQIDFILLLTSLFWLWTFGRIFQDLTGNRRIIPLFIYGGLLGAIVFLITSTILSRTSIEGSMFNGASIGVVAIAIASTILSPQYRFFPMISGGIPLWVVTMIFILIDLSSLAGNSALVAAHLASGLTGYGFAVSLNRGKDWSESMNQAYEWFVNLFNPAVKQKVKKRVKVEVFYDTKGKSPFKKTSNLTQQRIDDILDKINQKGGYDRLTEEEKDLLRRASEEDI